MLARRKRRSDAPPRRAAGERAHAVWWRRRGRRGRRHEHDGDEYALIQKNKLHQPSTLTRLAFLFATAVKKAQQVGQKVKELQEELQDTEIEAVAADGGVTVVISGAQVPLSVEVTEELLAKGSAAVSEAVSVAAKEAHTNSMEYAKSRMSELYGEIGLPMPPQQ